MRLRRRGRLVVGVSAAVLAAGLGVGVAPVGATAPSAGTPTISENSSSVEARGRVLANYDYETGDFSQVEQFQTQTQRCSDSERYIFGSMFRIVKDNPRSGRYAIEHRLKNCDERSETVVEGDRLRAGRAYRMTWSMLMPKNYLGADNSEDKGAIVQQHGINWPGKEPAKKFIYRCGKPIASDMILEPDRLRYRLSYPAGISNGRPVLDCKKTDLSPMKPDVWSDFKIEVKYSDKSDGYLKLWQDGKQYIDYHGALLFPGNKPGDVKIGLYLGDPGKGERILRTDELVFEELR